MCDGMRLFVTVLVGNGPPMWKNPLYKPRGSKVSPSHLFTSPEDKVDSLLSVSDSP